MPINIAPCACPPLLITAESLGISSVQVTIDSGAPATVRLMGPGVDYVLHGSGPFEFQNLQPATMYSVVVTNDCGDGQTVSTTVTTDACPAVVISQVASTPNSVTIEVNGAAAEVTLGDQSAMVADGGQHVFTGLAPASSYTVRAATVCGATALATVTTAACPAIATTFTATPSSVTITVTGGAPAQVILAGQTQTVAVDGGSVTFTGLPPSTPYSAQVVSACGNESWYPVATTACPVITVTAAETTSSIAITVTQGAPAVVTLNGVSQPVAANGGTVTFAGLQAGVLYSATVESACGNADVFTFTTASCAPIVLDIATAGLDSFEVSPVSGGPVDLVVYNNSGQIVGAATGLADGAVAVFEDLATGVQYRVVATSPCGSEAVRFVTTGTAPCPSYPLYPHGFGYTLGDLVDPAADVAISVVGGDDTIYIYPDPAEGRTAKVRDADRNVLGYAQNQSCCTYGGCCSPEEYVSGTPVELPPGGPEV